MRVNKTTAAEMDLSKENIKHLNIGLWTVTVRQCRTLASVATSTMLWGIGRLSKGISWGDKQNVFPIALAQLSRKTAKYYLFVPGSFSISKYIFIPLSVFHHPHGYASLNRYGACGVVVHLKGGYQITVVRRSCTRTEDGGLEERPAGSHYDANRHRWPWPEQGIKSVGRHPVGELWAFPRSHSNWAKHAREK